MAAMLALADSQFRKYEMLYNPSAPRGPPPEAVRHVYIVGQVSSFKGPEEFGASLHMATVFDLKLAPAPEEMVQYEGALALWRSEIRRHMPEPRWTGTGAEYRPFGNLGLRERAWPDGGLRRDWEDLIRRRGIDENEIVRDRIRSGVRDPARLREVTRPRIIP
jgi:hypothetical protein